MQTPNIVSLRSSVTQSLMAEFTGDLQSLKPSFSEMNSNMEVMNNLSAYGFMAFSNDHQQPQSPINFTHNIQSSFDPHGAAPTAAPVVDFSLESKKEKNLGGRKRKRNNEGEVEKPGEVIHVRAKRGQATDSHSLAERVRREKINERLRCLQDLVPGCYKTMGMAVMLDVIVKYVQSLQNQIEFLSMKLSAASLFYDFNSSEMDAMPTMQGSTNAYEAPEMERMMREGYGRMEGSLIATQHGLFDCNNFSSNTFHNHRTT